MSVQQDRLTFFGVLIAVVVVVIGYLQIGGFYPAAGHAQPDNADASQAADAHYAPAPAELDTHDPAHPH